MAGGFSWSMDWDTSGIKKGGQQAADAIENTSDAFKAMAKDADRAGSKAGDSIESGIEDGVRASDKALEKLTQAMKDTAKAAEKSGQQMKDGIKVDKDDLVKAGMMEEAQQNFAESGAEVARGFRDGFNSEDIGTIIDGATDTIVASMAVLGPAGTAAGVLIGAAFAGISGALLADATAKSTAYKETYTNAFEAIKENGEQMGKAMIEMSKVDAIMSDSDKMKEAKNTAKTTGGELADVILAMSGNQEALNRVQEAGAATTEALSQKYKDAGGAQQVLGDETGFLTDAQAHQRDATSAVDGALGKLTATASGVQQGMADAATSATVYAQATETANVASRDTAVKLAASSQEAQNFTATIDGATVALQAMPDGQIVTVSDQGTAALTQSQIDQIDGKTVTMSTKADTSGAERDLQQWLAIPRRGQLNITPDFVKGTR